MTPSSPHSSTVGSVAEAVGEHKALVAARLRSTDKSFIFVGFKVKEAVLIRAMFVVESCSKI
jgi:hypothetical protein